MTENEKNDFAQNLLKETYDLDALRPLDENVALNAILSDIDDILALNQPEVLKRRNEWLSIPGTTEDSFREKLYTCSSNRKILAGIRHVGGNPNLPFVHVTPGFILSEECLFEIGEILLREFKVFQPTHFTIWLKPNSVLTQKLPSATQAARQYLAAKISNLLSRPIPSSDLPLRIEPVLDESYLKWCESEYCKFHIAHPELKSWVLAPEEASLREYQKQGLLYRASLEGKVVGLIGGKEDSLLGVKSLYMGELLIAEEFRGRGIAPLMQRLFIEQVANRFEVVWGTIDSRNIPSTKTGLRVGRQILRTEYFVPLVSF